MSASRAYQAVAPAPALVRGNGEASGLDSYDIRILQELQADASRTIAEIGAEVNLSQNACWRRIKRLEDDGYITGRVALVDPDRVGLGVTVFVTLRIDEHSQEYLRAFAETVSRIPEIVEFHRMSGDVDYLIKVYVSSIGDYDRVYKKLITGVRIRDVSSSFTLETMKATTALPLRYAR